MSTTYEPLFPEAGDRKFECGCSITLEVVGQGVRIYHHPCCDEHETSDVLKERRLGDKDDREEYRIHKEENEAHAQFLAMSASIEAEVIEAEALEYNAFWD